MAGENEQVALWLQISGALMRSLFDPACLLAAARQVEQIGASAYADLVDAHNTQVDHALVALATAADEAAVKFIAEQLTDGTRTVLIHRWAHYTSRWRELLHDSKPPLWVPPRPDEVWRAVFLSMTIEGIHSTAAAAVLWPRVFAAHPG